MTDSFSYAIEFFQLSLKMFVQSHFGTHTHTNSSYTLAKIEEKGKEKPPNGL